MASDQSSKLPRKLDESQALQHADLKVVLLKHGQEFDAETISLSDSRSVVIPGEWLDVYVIVLSTTQEKLGLTREEYTEFFGNLKIEARILDKPQEPPLGKRNMNQFVVANKFDHLTGPKAFPTVTANKGSDEMGSIPSVRVGPRATPNTPEAHLNIITYIPEDFYDPIEEEGQSPIINSQNEIIYQHRMSIGLPMSNYSRSLDISLVPIHPFQRCEPMSESRRRCIASLNTIEKSHDTNAVNMLGGVIENTSWTHKKHNIEVPLETLNPLKIDSVQSSKTYPSHITFVVENNHPTEELVILSANIKMDKFSGTDDILLQLQKTPFQIHSRCYDIPFGLQPNEQQSLLFTIDGQKLGQKSFPFSSHFNCVLSLRWKLPKMGHVIVSQFSVLWVYEALTDILAVFEAPSPVKVDVVFTAKATITNTSHNKRYDLALQTTLPHLSGYGSTGLEIQREVLQGINAPIICLDKMLNIGELGPKTSTTIEIRFLPLRCGLTVPCGIQLTDREGGHLLKTDCKFNVMITDD